METKRARLIDLLKHERIYLAESLAALAIAVVIGRDHWLSVVAAYAWGALLLGTSLFVVLLVLARLSRPREARVSSRPRLRRAAQVAVPLLYVLVLVSWEPEDAAFLAGYMPGVALSLALLVLVGAGPGNQARASGVEAS